MEVLTTSSTVEQRLSSACPRVVCQRRHVCHLHVSADGFTDSWRRCGAKRRRGSCQQTNRKKKKTSSQTPGEIKQSSYSVNVFKKSGLTCRDSCRFECPVIVIKRYLVSVNQGAASVLECTDIQIYSRCLSVCLSAALRQLNSAGMWWRNQVGFHEQVSVVFLPRVSHTVSPPVLISTPAQVFFIIFFFFSVRSCADLRQQGVHTVSPRITPAGEAVRGDDHFLASLSELDGKIVPKTADLCLISEAYI